MNQLLTAQDFQNYGGELIDLSQRAVISAVGPELQQLHRQNDELRNRLARETRRTVEQRLEQAVPDWRSIDQSAEWQRWLSMPDPLSGVIRQTLLSGAIANGDAHRVVGFFEGFRCEAGGADDDSDYAVAHRARRRAAAVNFGQPTYTRAQIQRFYEQRRKGLYDDAQWQRLENEIVRAGAEGRISGALDVNGR
jgi:hypothetical protein